MSALRAGLYAVVGIAVVALIAPLLAWWMPQHAGAFAIAALVGAGGVVGAAIALGGVIPARRWRHDAAVARYVGTRERAIASDLLSAVELGASRETGEAGATPDRFSPHLVDALVEATATRAQALPVTQLVPPSTLRRAGRAAGAAIIIYAGLALLAPAPLAAGWSALLQPPGPGPYGGASLSDQPLVGDLDITLEYPLYAQREPLRLPTSSGDFRAMPGTTVTISTRALTPVTAARIVFGDELGAHESDATVPAPVEMTVAGDRLSASFTVTAAGAYRFLLEDGRSSRVEARPHRIELEPDRAPVVELYAPAEELDVTSLKRVELAYIAEDDYGIDKVELVWSQDGEGGRKELVLPDAGRQPKSAQSKFLWDLADVTLEPGVRVAYHIEVTDNDTVLGPNVGKSRELYLRVFSPRERHEQNLERQRELFEKMVRNLGGRLVVATEDLPAHQILSRDGSELVVELGTLVAGLEEDELAARDLRAAFEDMRGRLDRLHEAELELLGPMVEKQAAGKSVAALEPELARSDAALVTELEDDVILLADWIERQQLENVLAIQDEIKVHQERLRELFKEYERTGDPALLAEIEREMKQLEKLLAEVATKQQGLTEDVLDQFVNTEAMQAEEGESCIAEARALLAAGDAAAAQARMDECMSVLDEAAMAMEQALSALRGDKFSEEEKKLGELMNELADLTRDQDDIADAADELWDSYAERADEMMRDKAREMRKQLDETIDEMRKQLDEVPADGLTAFSREELELVESRLDDLERMLADGDMAEALAMARQAEASLETMSAELEAALEEEDGPWSKRTEQAAEGIAEALPMAAELVDELAAATPSPDEIMSPADRRKLDQLRRRQKAARDRARKLADKAGEQADELPGGAGEAIAGGVGEAAEQMQRAEDRMKSRDPSGSRQEARGAAETLRQTGNDAQGAARQRQGGRSGLRDEPVRIPGADEYRVPEKFREDILEAMKKEEAPEGFDELVRRYYEELIR